MRPPIAVSIPARAGRWQCRRSDSRAGGQIEGATHNDDPDRTGQQNQHEFQRTSHIRAALGSRQELVESCGESGNYENVLWYTDFYMNRMFEGEFVSTDIARTARITTLLPQ